MQAQVEEFTADYVARTCGISVQDLVSAVKMYGTARSAAILYCLGVTEHTTGTDGVMALSNIAMVTGNLGKPGAGMNPLRGQNNVQGACDMGAGPDDYPGYQKVWDPAVRAKFEEAWGVELPDWAGTKATECFPAMLTGGIKGLYLFGEDPVRTDPTPAMCSSRSRRSISSWCRTCSSPRRPSWPTSCCRGAATREGGHVHQHRTAHPARAQGG